MDHAPDPVIEIFNQALKLAPPDRIAYLEQACASDSGLHRQVESLLHAHESAGGFLTDPVALLQAGAPRRPGGGEVPGDLIGKYKLLEQIGEGGCGVVFMAEQQEPVRRQVALKIVKPGMDTRSVIAQFESERQALALMEHPHIAQVLDAGATDAGRPYFVMELVRGTRITDYCDHNSLTPAARLELFVQVCHAIQHAHQKGIIHRDIKPSNILVSTTGEGKPLPKVIDFGIAKATTGQRLTDKTLFTAFEILVGTPTYMSPEQAALRSVDIDTRTDIYSLGVLLYELLAGTTPFDVRDWFKSGLEEVRRAILSKEPIRPSTRLKTMPAADLAAAAQHRQVEPLRLIRLVRGDLDWIVMKAMEKDRARRYPTANALAVDVQRHLANEPVLARPPSTLYQVGKLVARNRLFVGSLAVIALVLVTSLAIVSVLLARERTAHEQAEIEKHTARKEATKSKEVSRFLQEMFAGVAPAVAMGRDITILKEILDRTDREIGMALAKQPEVEAELRLALGGAYMQIGDYEAGERMLRRAGELQAAASPSDPRELATVHNRLGTVLLRQDRYEEAEHELQAALGLWRHAHAEEEQEAVDTLQNLAMLRWRQHKIDEAETIMREVLELRRKSLPPDHDEILTSLQNLGGVLYSLERLDEAEQIFRQVLEMQTRQVGAEHPDLGITLRNLASVLLAGKRIAEAKKHHARAVDLYRKFLLPGDPRRTESVRVLAQIHCDTGELTEAETLYREAVKDGRRTPDDFNWTVLHSLQPLVALLQEQGRLPEVEALFDGLLTAQLLSSPKCVPVLALRVEFRARTGSWESAIGEAWRLVELEPDQQDHYHTLAPLLVAGDRAADYRKLCAEMISRFSRSTDIYIADRVAKDCLILPGAVADLAPVALLADHVAREGKDQGSLPFFQVCKALSDYRQGRFADAIAMAETAGDKIPHAEVIALAIRAMAARRLDEPELANSLLAQGHLAFKSKLPEIESGDLGQNWRDWIIARELLAEARAVVEGQ